MRNLYSIDHCNTSDVRVIGKLKRNMLFYAYTYAMNSDVNHGRHCAIVLNESWDNPVSISINDRERHAEVGAIEAIPPHVDTEKCFIVVVRATRTGKMTISMPCNNCKAILRGSGIKNCIYSSDHFKFKKCIIS